MLSLWAVLQFQFNPSLRFRSHTSIETSDRVFAMACEEKACSRNEVQLPKCSSAVTVGYPTICIDIMIRTKERVYMNKTEK